MAKKNKTPRTEKAVRKTLEMRVGDSGDFVAVNGSLDNIEPIEIWNRTMELRCVWVPRELIEVEGKIEGGLYEKVLEQKWISNTGEEKWEQIPVIEE